MSLQNAISQTLERVSSLHKAGISTTTGLVFYDLEQGAKYQYPVLAPIRKTMPRIGSTNPQGGQGLAAHWNVITNPNSTSLPAYISEGKRAGVITPAVSPKIATYKGIGQENVVTWEGEYAGQGYEDVRGTAQRTALDALILAEEPMLLWANSGNSGTGLQYGTTPTPTGTGSTTGGALAATTYYVYCVALGYDGYTYALAQSPVTVVPTITRTNADGTTTTINMGVGQVSAQSAGVVVGGSGAGSLTATVAAVKGAVGYAWFLGSATGASNCYIYSVTSVNKVVMTTLPTTGQTASQLPAADYSYNPLAFDGLISQALSSNGYFVSLDGAAFTGDGANGINEINTALKYFWDTYRISPTKIRAGSGTVNSITKIILSTSGQASFRINLQNDPSNLGALTGGAYVGDYLNRFCLDPTKKMIPVELHPNMPDGHCFFDLEINPYPTSNIPLARAVRTRRDYFQVIWPARTRQWENGIYSDQMLQVYVPYGMGLISNIANS